MFSGSSLGPLPWPSREAAVPEGACPGGKKDGGNYLIYSSYFNRLLGRIKEESWHRLAHAFP